MEKKFRCRKNNSLTHLERGQYIHSQNSYLSSSLVYLQILCTDRFISHNEFEDKLKCTLNIKSHYEYLDV